MRLSTLSSLLASLSASALASPANISRPIIDPATNRPVAVPAPAIPPHDNQTYLPFFTLNTEPNALDSITCLNGSTRHLLSALSVRSDTEPACLEPCNTFFALKFDRRAKPEHNDDDDNRTPHIQLIAGRGGRTGWHDPISFHNLNGWACTQGCDVDDKTWPGDTRVTKWVKLQCRHVNVDDWRRAGGGWERVDLMGIKLDDRGVDIRPNVPEYIDVHAGDYCKRHPYDERIGNNVWIRYRGVIYNLPEDCAYLASPRLFDDPWIGRCVFGGYHFEGFEGSEE